MATSYPAAIDNYTTKADGVDTVQAAHINNVQDAIEAIETALGTNPGVSGSWTPGFDAESGQVGSFTYGTQTGRYIKLGKLVYLFFTITWTAKPSAGNILRLTGLPFTPANANSVQGFVTSHTGITFTPTTGVTGTQIAITNYAASQFATFKVFSSGSTNADGRISMAALAASGSIIGVIIYDAA